MEASLYALREEVAVHVDAKFCWEIQNPKGSNANLLWKLDPWKSGGRLMFFLSRKTFVYKLITYAAARFSLLGSGTRRGELIL